jgi:hypothetical protein
VVGANAPLERRGRVRKATTCGMAEDMVDRPAMEEICVWKQKSEEKGEISENISLKEIEPEIQTRGPCRQFPRTEVPVLGLQNEKKTT